MNIANCTKCRRIFQKSISPLCPECHQESMAKLSNAYRFIQENPQMTLEDIAFHCDIPLKELEEMFFAGKLGTATNSVIYHCQLCGRPLAAMMRRGRFCLSCAERVETEAGLVPDKQTENPEKTKAARQPEPTGPGVSEVKGSQDPPEKGRTTSSRQEPAGGSYGFKRVNE